MWNCDKFQMNFMLDAMKCFGFFGCFVFIGILWSNFLWWAVRNWTIYYEMDTFKINKKQYNVCMCVVVGGGVCVVNGRDECVSCFEFPFCFIYTFVSSCCSCDELYCAHLFCWFAHIWQRDNFLVYCKSVCISSSIWFAIGLIEWKKCDRNNQNKRDERNE